MKRILILAPSSFPIVNSEAITNAKLIYLLAQMGYDVVVLSRISNLKAESLYPESEEERKILSLNNVQVEYLNVYNGVNFYSMLEHLLCFLMTGCVYRGANWNYYAIKKAVELNKKKKFDILITRGFYTEIAGIYLTRKLKIKWIANWNDPYPLSRFPPPYGLGPNCKISFMQNLLLLKIQKNAFLHTFPSARLRDYMLQYLPLVKREQTTVIPHLAHEDFFWDKKKCKRDKMCIVHAGNVSYPRSPKKFLKALTFLSGKLKNKLDCIFVGKQTEDFMNEIKILNLTSVVHVLPPMNYFDILKLLSNSDISLIIEAECTEGIYLPTKFADAMQSQIPVFCVSPVDGTLHDMVSEYEVGYFADVTSISDIKNQMEKMFFDWENDKLPIIAPDRVSYFFSESVRSKYEKILN